MTASSSLILRGIVSVIFGILAFAWPGLTLAALVLLFGAFALLDGISNIAHGATSKHSGSHTWLLIAQGVIGVAAGIVAFVWPGITLLVLVMVVGLWAVMTGALEVVAAIRLRRVITGEWLLAMSGILSILLGALVFLYPLTGTIVLAWWVGVYALISGIVLIALGARLRHHVPITL
jgi:uncharacterized membrane protein HdeD (DUF308 family)